MDENGRPGAPQRHLGSNDAGVGAGTRATTARENLTRVSTGAELRMKTLLVLLFCASLHLQQPGVTYGPQGERRDTFKTPSGTVTYDEQGRSIERYDKEQGSVWYDAEGRRWESYGNEKPSFGVKHGD